MTDFSGPIAAAPVDEVVAAATAGDEAAFGTLVERHRRELQLHCYRMLRSSDLAEDAVQETFLRAWRARSTFAGRSKFRTWLYCIATNACRDELSRGQRRVVALGFDCKILRVDAHELEEGHQRKAGLEYPRVRAGLILMMDRTFTHEQNEVIVEKAIRYASRGIVGVDIAGPRPNGGRYPYRDLAPLVETARAAGLGIMIHVGEEGGRDGIEEIAEVVEHLRPERIGHGILAAQDEEVMGLLKEAGVVLEICPTSNLLTGALPDEDALRDTVRTFVDRGVAFTIATDGPEMMRTHLTDELELLVGSGSLDAAEAREVNARGHDSAFLPPRM